MVGRAELCFADALSAGGGAHFEWPRRCRGWQRRRVRAMVASLKLLLADFDGCAVGVMSGPGLPALKPWRVATSRPRVAAALSTLRCPGDHDHGHLSGAWATKSGHYTPHFCQIVLEAVAEDLADSAGLWPTSRVLHLTDPKPRRHGRGKGHLERRARRYSLATLLGMRRRAPLGSDPG